MKNISFTKISQIISIIMGFAIVLSPVLVLAQYSTPSSAGTGLKDTLFGATTLTGLILNIINILLALSGLIAVLVLIIGGFRYVTSFGNEEAVDKAKHMILNAIIGIVIIILSFVIVKVVSNVALKGSGGSL